MPFVNWGFPAIHSFMYADPLKYGQVGWGPGTESPQSGLIRDVQLGSSQGSGWATQTCTESTLSHLCIVLTVWVIVPVGGYTFGLV